MRQRIATGSLALAVFILVGWPKPLHGQAVANAQIQGLWQLAPIISIHSGTWFSPVTGLDNCLTGIGNDRPNVQGNPYIKSTTASLQWLNPGAFTPNAIGTFGNAGSDSLLGPGYANVDVDVSRYFTIHEKQKLEARFEFFNIANHTNFSTPDNNLQDNTFPSDSWRPESAHPGVCAEVYVLNFDRYDPLCGLNLQPGKLL